MIELRPWSDEDLSLLMRGNAPEMTEHLGGPETDEQVVQRHEKYLRFWREGVARQFAVLQDGEPVGVVGWWDGEWQDEPVHEAGWFVVPEAQGRGVAKEAVRLVVEDVREHAQLPLLTAYPSADNAASNGVCRTAGFRVLGEHEFPFRGVTIRATVWGLDIG